MAKKGAKKTALVEVEYVITHTMVIEVEEPDDVDYQIEIIGSTLGTHGTMNYREDGSRDVKSTEITYKYTKSGKIP